MQGARVLSSQKESTTQKNRTENKQTIHTFPAKKKKKLSLFIREKLFFFFFLGGRTWKTTKNNTKGINVDIGLHEVTEKKDEEN